MLKLTPGNMHLRSTFTACTQYAEDLVYFLSKDTLQGLRLISKDGVLAPTYRIAYKVS